MAPVELQYRLYYNELGEITGASMTDHHEGQFLVVDANTYQQYFQYRVVDGRLTKIEPNAGYRVKLQKSSQGYRTVRNHAGLMLEPDETYPDTEYYEHRNN